MRGVKKFNKLVIRFRRRGCRFYPFYEIGVLDQMQRSRGRFIEKLGYFNPNFTERRLEIDGEKLAYWLNKGAVVSVTVKKYIVKFLVK